MRTIKIAPTAFKTHVSAGQAIQYAKQQDDLFWQTRTKARFTGKKVEDVSFDDATLRIVFESGECCEVGATDDGGVNLRESSTENLFAANIEPVIIVHWGTTPTRWKRHEQAQRLLGRELREFFFNGSLYLYFDSPSVLALSGQLTMEDQSPLLFWCWE